MAEVDAIDVRLTMAAARRANAKSNRDRALLNIEIAERSALAAEARLAEEDDNITRLLDEKLAARTTKAGASA